MDQGGNWVCYYQTAQVGSDQVEETVEAGMATELTSTMNPHGHRAGRNYLV